MREKKERASTKRATKSLIQSDLEDYQPKHKSIFDKSDFDNLKVVLTPKQKLLQQTICSNTLTIVRGPAGCAKTFLSCYTALGLLAEKKVNKIIITKPIVEAGEEIGILPGDLAEKTTVYMKSYISTFEKILGKFLSDILFQSGVIEINFLAYMRGDTFDKSVMILDEAQNVKMSQLMLWATRLGKGSLMILAGDVSQHDIELKDAKFLNFIEICKDMKGVADFEFNREDIVRNSFLIELTDRYEKWKYK